MKECAGWAPRTTDDNGIDTLDTTTDYHVWLEDKNGNVFYYPDNELCIGCHYKTDNVVGQEWKGDLVRKIGPRIEATAEDI